MTPSPNPAPHDLPGGTTEEWQSAWYDRDLSAGTTAGPGDADAREPDPVRLQEYQRLSQLLQALPVEPLPADFASRVMAQLPARSTDLHPQPEAPKPPRPARFPLRPLGWLAASLAGVAILVARWQPAARAPQEAIPSAKSSASIPVVKGTLPAARASLEVRPSLAFQLNHIPPEKLAIVRIRVPQRGTNPQGQDQAIGLTERAFGEQRITQAMEGQQSPEALPGHHSSAPDASEPAVAGLRTTAGPADPMLLLVVGESEAIVNALEQLLENLDQTDLEQEIQAVAQTELEQLSTELNRSLEGYLANLEQSWNPAGAPASDSPPGGGSSRFAKEQAPADALQTAASPAPSRSRGWMAWLPPDSPANSSAATSPQTAAGLTRHEGAAVNQARSLEAKRDSAAPEQPGRVGSPTLARPLARERLNDSSPAKSATDPVMQEDSNQGEGNRTRRVLIQIICQPAG